MILYLQIALNSGRISLILSARWGTVFRRIHDYPHILSEIASNPVRAMRPEARSVLILLMSLRR
jgi:hypothetical protein